tara:strand:+ start:1021 stop:4203 length:3183 start_codon:yes stop_codon:yes gene_type:complete
MTSEIRSNKIKNRAGLGTVTFSGTGAILSGIVTASDDFRANEIRNQSGLGTITVSNSGTVVAGILSATKFVGDGTGLTGNLSYSGNYLGMSDTPSSFTAGAFHRSNNAANAMQNSANLFEDSSGNIGIGENNPLSKLHVKKGSGDTRITIESGGNNIPFEVGVFGGASSGFYIANSSTLNNIFTSNSSDYVTVYGGGQQRIETTNTGVTISGVLDSTGDLQISDKIIHTGDTNTAIRFPLSDTIAFETGGTERYRINSSGNSIFAGNISAVDGTFSGDVLISGTLTYEDVTNIDSVGIITARSDIKVGTAVTLTSAGAGFYAGIVTASDFVKRDGSSIGGVASDAQQNTVAGTNAGDNFSGTDAACNTLFGYDAGTQINTGDHNTCIGFQAGDSINSGLNNTLVGSYAGAFLTDTNNNANVAIGYKAMQISSGDYNVAIGWEAMKTNTNQSSNVAIGAGAMHSATGANKCVAIGRYALEELTTGGRNTAVGNSAAHEITIGNFNVCIGENSGDTITEGGNNIVIGWDADASSATVDNEITLGNTSITNFRIPGIGVTFATSGNHISGITTFSDRIKLGSSGQGEIYYSGGIKIDSTAQIELETNNQLYIHSITNGVFLRSKYQTVIAAYGGSGGGVYFQHNGNDKLKLEGGNWTYQGSPTVTFDGNILASSDGALDIGTNSVRFRNIYADNIYGDGTNITGISGGGGAVTLDSYNNLFGGTDAGASLNSSSYDNVLFGQDAGDSINSGYENVCIGLRAGQAITDTRRNTCVGSDAGRNFSSGDSTFIGWNAGNSASSNGNICVGHNSGTEANGNDTAVGYSCGPTGSYSGGTNVCYGFTAGNGLRQSASRNTIIGPGAGRNASTGQVNIEGSHNIIIGDEASLSSTTVSNECVIGAVNGQSKTITKFRIPGVSASISTTESVLPAANFNAGVLQEAFYHDTGSGIQGNYSHDILTYGMVFNQVTNAAGNFTFNIRGNSSTTFDSLTTTGKVTTMTIYSANNSTSNYMTAFKIDGTTQTVKWAGGSAPSAATGSGVDVYSMTIMKTGSNAYNVFGNLTNFA